MFGSMTPNQKLFDNNLQTERLVRKHNNPYNDLYIACE